MSYIQNGVLDPAPGAFLTSPVAYLSSIPMDPFGLMMHQNFQNNNFDEISWWYYTGYNEPLGMAIYYTRTYYVWKKNVKYFFRSVGPSRHLSSWGYQIYDPTNGTVSVGEILYLGSEGQKTR